MKTIFMLCSLFLVGCASSSSILTGAPRPPTDPASVRVYAVPPPNYEAIGIVSASSRNSWAASDQGKTNKALERLKVEAARLGANGILLGNVADDTASAPIFGSTPTGGFYSYSVPVRHKSLSGTAIFVNP